MKYLKLFESFKEVDASEYSEIDRPEDFNKRELDLIGKIANDNKWDYLELTRDSDAQIEFYKKEDYYFYRITIEKQYDEYYLVSVDLECCYCPDKDSSRYFVLDTYEELLEFLQKVERFYNHKRLYDIKGITSRVI